MRDGTRLWTLLATAAVLLLPLLVLMPLGALWLWQQGWLLYWLGAGAVLGLVGYGLSRWLQGPPSPAEPDDVPEGAVSPPDADWSQRDLAAWAAVQALAAEVDPAIVTRYRDLLAVARRTIATVAAHYHPEERHPVWRFTLPEALLVTERVSVRLRRVLLDRVPGAHLIRVSRLVRLWEFQPAARTGLKWFRGAAWVYRAARLVNPMGAVLAETRERLFSNLLDEAGDELRRRGGRIWVEEVGRAAIELYSGRLQAQAGALDEAALERAAGPGVPVDVPPGPVRILVAGAGQAGKSSLINALTGRTVAGVDVLPATRLPAGHTLETADLPGAVLIDTPALEGSEGIATLVDQADQADGILWVSAAHRADRALDRRALQALRQHWHQETTRPAPPLLGVVSHVDRLSPVREWDPPYDTDAPRRPKERAMRQAMEAVAADLEIPLERLVAARLDHAHTVFHVERILALLAAHGDQARRCRALRVMQQGARGPWRQVLDQTARAGAGAARRWIGRHRGGHREG
ncbi:GTPase family protein [Ectothiorhodospira mobilis]|uniref:GTPase family protein n=1 Tax=Ectothiorhodospira mobilis TaxID=195064 RepID=UPI001902D020|nr:GTPase [Ectothiorhodospira mobilis]MBK1692118.1 GTP-binding protein HSR1 [Ectothiorhodospira mobilis]